MTLRLPFVLSLALIGGAAPAVEITQRSQAVPARGIGHLRTNLRCTTALDPLHLSARGVFVGRGATLNLNSFTITGDGTGVGIECAGCTLNGPGEITNFEVAITGGGGRVRFRTSWRVAIVTAWSTRPHVSSN